MRAHDEHNIEGGRSAASSSYDRRRGSTSGPIVHDRWRAGHDQPFPAPTGPISGECDLIDLMSDDGRGHASQDAPRPLSFLSPPPTVAAPSPSVPSLPSPPASRAYLPRTPSLPHPALSPLPLPLIPVPAPPRIPFGAPTDRKVLAKETMRPPKYGGHSKRDQLGSVEESWGPLPDERRGLFGPEPEPPSPPIEPFVIVNDNLLGKGSAMPAGYEQDRDPLLQGNPRTGTRDGAVDSAQDPTAVAIEQALARARKGTHLEGVRDW